MPEKRKKKVKAKAKVKARIINRNSNKVVVNINSKRKKKRLAAAMKKYGLYAPKVSPDGAHTALQLQLAENIKNGLNLAADQKKAELEHAANSFGQSKAELERMQQDMLQKQALIHQDITNANNQLQNIQQLRNQLAAAPIPQTPGTQIAGKPKKPVKVKDSVPKFSISPPATPIKTPKKKERKYLENLTENEQLQKGYENLYNILYPRNTAKANDYKEKTQQANEKLKSLFGKEVKLPKNYEELDKLGSEFPDVMDALKKAAKETKYFKSHKGISDAAIIGHEILDKSLTYRNTQPETFETQPTSGTGTHEGSSILYDDEIERYLHPLTNRGFLGVFMNDQIKNLPAEHLKPEGGLIMNTDPSKNKAGHYNGGTHWVALYWCIRPKNDSYAVSFKHPRQDGLYYYDPFGRAPSDAAFHNIFVLMNKVRKKYGINYELPFQWNECQHQALNSTECGYFSSLWLVECFNGFDPNEKCCPFKETMEDEKKIKVFKKMFKEGVIPS